MAHGLRAMNYHYLARPDAAQAELSRVLQSTETHKPPKRGVDINPRDNTWFDLEIATILYDEAAELLPHD